MSKVILITGASSGIGKATAQRLLADGHTVYCTARTTDKMQELAAQGGKLLPLDVTDSNQIQTAVDTIISEQGRVDVLFNNAGYGLYGAVEDIPLQDARQQFEVNLFGLAAVTKAVLPHMRAQKSGRIINTSSMGGKIYTPMGAWYHATKHAVEGWSDCLRLEVAPHGIQVVVIEPGAINTGFGEPMVASLEKHSVHGPYAEMAQGMADAGRQAYDNGGTGSAPSVVAAAVAHAVSATTPKTRYAIGKYAKPFLFIRKFVSDRVFDWMVLQMVKRNS